ncbi:MAG: alpha/beta hydrolase [Caldilineaceae bacterium]
MFGIDALINQFVFYPDRVLVANPHMLALPFQDVWLETADDMRVHGWFLPCEDAVASVLFLHGNAGNISHRLDNLRLLVERARCQVLIIDYRGYGRSDGLPDERGTYVDATAAWTWLTTHTPGPHVIFGRSLGGAVAVQTAVTATPPPDGLIVENTFTRLLDIAADMVPFPAMLGLLPDIYPTLARMPQLTVPVMVIHSEQDELIPVNHAHTLFAAAPEPKELYVVAGGRHNDAYLVGGDDYWRRFSHFLHTLPPQTSDSERPAS